MDEMRADEDETPRASSSNSYVSSLVSYDISFRVDDEPAHERPHLCLLSLSLSMVESCLPAEAERASASGMRDDLP